MKVLIDLNIFIDVLQKRQEFLKASLQIVKQALTGKLTGRLPAHSVTTGVYICNCHGNGARKDDALSLILDKRIAVIPCDRKILLEARKLGFADYEDAVARYAARPDMMLSIYDGCSLAALGEEEAKAKLFSDFMNDDPLPENFRKALAGERTVTGIVAEGDDGVEEEVEVVLAPNQVARKTVGVVGSLLKT